MTRTLALAEMPEIDHRVRQTFQGIVQLTNGSLGVRVGIKSFTQQAFQPFSMAMFETSDPLIRSKRSSKRRNLSSQANTRSMVKNRS